LQQTAELQHRLHQLEQRMEGSPRMRIARAQAATDGCCSSASAPSTSVWEELSLFQAELRAKVDAQDLQLRRLGEQQEQLLAEAKVSQESLKKALREVSDLAGQAREDVELDFGAPIGKTLNTQDMAAMHAETRRELAECRRRISEVADMVVGGPTGGGAEVCGNPMEAWPPKAALVPLFV